MKTTIHSGEVFRSALIKLAVLYDLSESKALAYWLFEEYLSLDRPEVHSNKKIGKKNLGKFNHALEELTKGRPIQHILGYAYFLGKKFMVNNNTLIPRPETEELVMHILKTCSDKSSFLDIGTGTGCIPISIKSRFRSARVVGWDLYDGVLETARKNANSHQQEVRFVKTDMTNEWPNEHFEVIVCNPPYVMESEKSSMHKNVLDHEPHAALFVSDEDPLLFYRSVAQKAKEVLSRNGRLIFEINEKHGSLIWDLLYLEGYSKLSIIKDMYGKDRIVTANFTGR